MRRPVSQHLHEFALDRIGGADPDALPVTVAGARVPSVGIGLLHRAVGIEDIHVV